MNLVAHVELTLRNRGLLWRGQRLVVAVSGGLDSMVLLHVLDMLATAQRWKITVAHFNHQLRGRSSDADERLVVRTAARLGWPVAVSHAAVGEHARQHKLSLEMAARHLRHEFLAGCAVRAGAGMVAVAHHADDQVELFFVRLLRGAGGEGLGGMKWRSPSPANRKVEIIRPLLDVPRAALEEYAIGCGLRFREDATNAAMDIQRNRIRHELLPLLRRCYQPGLSQTVLRLMEITGAESDFVRSVAGAWLKRSAGTLFKNLPVAVRRAVIRQQLIELGCMPDFERVESLVARADRRMSIGADLVAWRDEAGRVHAEKKTPLRFKPEAMPLALEGRTGDCVFGDLSICWRKLRARGVTRPPPVANQEWFDADAVGSAIHLRHWQPGDRFQPIGLAQPAKLQNLLTNARVPKARRRELVVATASDGRLCWVEGLRIGEAFKLTDGTNRRLQWRWQRL